MIKTVEQGEDGKWIVSASSASMDEAGEVGVSPPASSTLRVPTTV